MEWMVWLFFHFFLRIQRFRSCFSQSGAQVLFFFEKSWMNVRFWLKSCRDRHMDLPDISAAFTVVYSGWCVRANAWVRPYIGRWCILYSFLWLGCEWVVILFVSAQLVVCQRFRFLKSMVGAYPYMYLILFP